MANPATTRLSFPTPSPVRTAARRARSPVGRVARHVEERRGAVGVAVIARPTPAGGDLGPVGTDRGIARSDATQRPGLVPALVPSYAAPGQVPYRGKDTVRGRARTATAAHEGPVAGGDAPEPVPGCLPHGLPATAREARDEAPSLRRRPILPA